MSYVIGFNYNYMIDLSDKYIVPEKQIPKNSIVNVQNVNFVISYLNGINQLKHFKRIEQQQQQQEVDVNEQRNLAFLKFYHNFLVPYNKEINQLKPELTKTTPSTDLPLVGNRDQLNGLKVVVKMVNPKLAHGVKLY